MGQFEVTDCVRFTETASERALAFELLAKIEQHATHPIAHALKRFSEANLDPRLCSDVVGFFI
jgi:cation transport ATPase